MDVERIARQLRDAFPHGTLLRPTDANANELIYELEPGAEHPEYSKAVAVIERIPGHFSRRSTLRFTVLRGTLKLFPHGELRVLNVGDTCEIEPYVFFWAEADEACVEVFGTPAWTVQDRRFVGPEEEISLQPYDPTWSQRFEAEKALVEHTLGAWVHGGVHHVGSTSVPGIAAKPIVDIMVGVESLQRARACIDLLAGIQYEHLATRNSSMLWFCKPALEHRIFHLYLIEPTSDEWHARLAFAEYLRTHAEARVAYEQLKLSLAENYKDDRAAYTKAKTEFVEDIVRMALDVR
jgi:GrpB-like predicted nucleotidyltransferase (UPF0157 family)